MVPATRNLTATSLVVTVFLGLGLGLSAAETTDAQLSLVSQQQKTTKKKSTKGKKSTSKTPPKDMPKSDAPTTPAAAGNDSGLKFARDIAPIIVANCTNCHNAQHRSGLNQSTFEGLLKGGKSGKAIVPGKPDESLLLARVKGEEGAKMPPGQRDLSAASIEKIASWIKSGARLDAGLEATASLASFASTPEELKRQELAKLPVTERDKRTEEAGLTRLKKANDSAAPDVQKGTNFMVFSKLPKERATSVLKALDSQFSTLKRLLTTDKPALTGPEKISLYLFKDRASYVEFVRSVENQEVDDSETSRSKLTVESPYVIAIDPLAFGAEAATSATPKKSGRSKKAAATDDATGPERTLTGILSEAFASGSVAQAGGPPWVASGLGAYLASQTEPRSRYYAKLRTIAYEQCRLGWQAKATEVLGGQGKSEATRAIGFALFEWINSNAAPVVTANFVQGMLLGQAKLDDAIKDAFGMSREEFLTGSGEWVYARYATAKGR